MEDDQKPCIYVLAGTNGAGKSSVLGETLHDRGVEFFNPDEAARLHRELLPTSSVETANGWAWQQGVDRLSVAIDSGTDFALETTLGGSTITSLLNRALGGQHDVRVWYVGLDSIDRHLARVRARVATGGHDIPAASIRERFSSSPANLIRLLPGLADLWLFDNSEEAGDEEEILPAPKLILRLQRGEITFCRDPAAVPDWAKPIVAAALMLDAREAVPGVVGDR
ncbi:MAG: zeta toxin family protein [Candidatus Dormibacteria bacterium]